MATVIEMYLNGAWTAITSYVRVEAGINIQVGVQNESAVADANTCTLIVNNRDGRFTPRNTSGAYYPYLKRNTPLRVTVDGTVRFWGQVAEFPGRYNENGSDVYVPIVASGPLRRLAHAGSLDATLATAIRYLSTANGDITGYWPCEDASGATGIASGLNSGTAGTFTGTPVFEAVDLSAGTHNVPTWAGASATFIPATGSSTKFTAGCYIKLPTSGLTGGEELFRVQVKGTAVSWRILYSPGSGGSVFLQVLDTTGAELLSTANITVLDGSTFYVKLECSNSGANVAYSFSTLDAGTTISGSLTGASIGAPAAAGIGLGTIAIPADADVAVGHVVLGTSDTALFHSQFDSGRAAYAGESIESRLSRLATIYGLSIGVVSGATSPVEMGAQPDGTLLDVLRAAEKADAGGILRDAIDQEQLIYITRRARYNDQRAQLVMSYTAKQLVPPLEPTDDDQQLRNDVKANRTDGSSARIALTTGALSTANYPTGVGPYPFEDTYAIYSDDQLIYLASWVLRRGTVDETRFPAVTVDLIANPSKVGNIEAVRPGYRFQITNLPTYAGPATVDLQVLGWREHLSKSVRRVTFICEPQAPWNVFELNDTVYGRLDTGVLAY